MEAIMVTAKKLDDYYNNPDGNLYKEISDQSGYEVIDGYSEEDCRAMLAENSPVWYIPGKALSEADATKVISKEVRDMRIAPRILLMIENLSPQDKDDIYRYLWYQHVEEDVYGAASQLMDPEDNLDIIELAATRYVYELDYDCNLSYWDNIDNLIREESNRKTISNS